MMLESIDDKKIKRREEAKRMSPGLGKNKVYKTVGNREDKQ